jgi:predicted transcriptional regulator
LIPATALDCEDAVKKARLLVYLEPDMMAELAELADRKQQAMSLIAEAAITSFLTPDDSDRREAAVSRRLDRLTRQGERLERDLWIAAEALALFIRFWLTVTPPLPESAQAAAQAKGRERFESFLETLGRRLAKGQSVLREISHDQVDGADGRREQMNSSGQSSSQGDQP